MTTELKIKQVADASGFTAATLRYYEQIGLLPEASRTPAGYRMYDQRTLDSTRSPNSRSSPPNSNRPPLRSNVTDPTVPATRTAGASATPV